MRDLDGWLCSFFRASRPNWSVRMSKRYELLAQKEPAAVAQFHDVPN